MERVIKQGVSATKLHTLVSKDDVQDPFMDIQRIAVTPPKPLAHYDDIELNGLLREVSEREFASMTVDGCLHVLAVNQRKRISGLSIDALIERELKGRMSFPNGDAPDCRGLLVPLQETIYSPVSMPVMMRPLKPLDIADICIGNVLLFFMFDMNSWGRLFQNCRLAWSSIKEGRKEKSKPFLERLMVVDSRIPTIKSCSGDSAARLGDRILPRLACEGIRPSSMAAYYEHMVTNLQSDKE